MALTADNYVRARIDNATKVRATEALNAMGLSVSDAIRLLLIRVADERRLPFEVQAPNAVTRAAMEESRALMAARHARFATPEDLFNALEKDAEESPEK